MDARTIRWIRLAGAALAAAAAAAFGWPWVALAVHAADYPVTGPGEAANVVIDGGAAYATLADRGLAVLDAGSGRPLDVVRPPAGSESVDDLAAADGFLFALDARPPGHLSVFSLADPAHPRLVAGPVAAEVGPFSAVSAHAGKVIVSGGTSRMSLRAYDGHGALSGVLATMDFGRGQPFVLLSRDGARAFVSTHKWGPYFALTTARVGGASIDRAGTLGVPTYGFTDGGAKPASFPLKLALEDDALLLADAEGLSVVGVADLDRPRLLAHLDLGIKGVSVDARDHLAAVVGSSPSPRLVLVDVTEPTSPRIVRTVALAAGSYPTGVAVGAARIAVASHRAGVQFIPR
jgi:hypothetical protein